MENHTIYVLSASGVFFYVGRTTRNPVQRLKEHIREAMDSRRVCNTKKAKLIRQLVLEGIEIKIEVLEESADEDREYYWVDQLKFEGRGLLNSKNGDQGTPLTSDERKQLRSQIQQFKRRKKWPKKGVTPEQIEKRRTAITGCITKSVAEYEEGQKKYKEIFG